MTRGLLAASILSGLICVGCSRMAEDEGQPQGEATSAHPAGSPPALPPARLNYELPQDLPVLAGCALKLELVDRRRRQIVWQTDRSAGAIRVEAEQALRASQWTLTDQRELPHGKAIVATKGQRRCVFVFSQEPDQPTVVILLLPFFDRP